MTKKILLLTYLLALCLPTYGTETLHYTHYQEHIWPLPQEDRFRTEVKASGYLIAGMGAIIEIPLHGTEQADELHIRYQDHKGRSHKVKGRRVLSSSAKSHFYEAKHEVLRFELPDKARNFNYSYRKNTTPLLLMAQFPLFVDRPTDTLSYSFHLPTDYELLYQFDEKTTDPFIVTNNPPFEGEAIVKMQLMPQICMAHKSPTSALAPDFKMPYLQVCIREKEAEQPTSRFLPPLEISENLLTNFLQDYLKFIEPSGEISSNTLNYFNDLTSGMSDSLRAATVFAAVRDGVSYVQASADIYSILPRKAEEVWQLKKGDCKDMSNLLYRIFEEMGYEASLVLTATGDHHYQGIFPSLGAYNHLAVLLKMEGKTYFLDATGKYNEMGCPIFSVQGQAAVAVNKNQVSKLQIPIMEGAYNQKIFSFKGSVIKEQLIGNFKQLYKGYATLLTVLPRDEMVIPLLSKNALREFDLSNTVGEARLDGGLTFPSISTQHEGKTYLPLGNLPLPNNYPKKIPAGFVLSFPYRLDNQFDFTIDFSHPISLSKPIVMNYSKEGLGFTLEIKQKDKDTLYISYRFTNEHLEISDELAEAYHEINARIKEAFKTVLILE